ncbi:MAG: HAD-IB family phosphatase [Clostridia bacterium]|nr:HAD-IB family phosphatase [Clostridia bacterium]
MNIYDFDKTIFYKDSTPDFYFYCVKKYPAVIKNVPKNVGYWILYKLGLTDKRTWKSKFYEYITYIPDIGKAVNDYWEINKNLIKPFYKEIQREDDLIISASSSFLLKKIGQILGIKNIIATDVDTNTGRLLSEHCYGEEKVRRFVEAGYKKEDAEDFYSDSYSDSPLAEIAQRAFIVKGNKILKWGKK